MQVISEKGKSPIKAWIDGVPLEVEAREQLLNLAGMPFIHKHIAVMPDVHSGKGSTIGSVIATKGAIIPAAVGVDIGCGMTARKLNIKANQLPDNLAPLRHAIEAAVPHGRSDNGGTNDRGRWGQLPEIVATIWNAELAQSYSAIVSKNNKLDQDSRTNTFAHLGTLGTGNHFIEVCKDENDSVWVMLHSGSRGVGNRIGTYFIDLAKKDMERFFINLPDTDLAYIPEGSDLFENYIQAVGWAQRFAELNRYLMMQATLTAMESVLGLKLFKYEMAISCHHNYVEKENHFGSNVLVTRKGAVRARAGELGIIPGSMGVGSYIVEGLGNPDSFNSCSHGAGRTMSRTKARATISMEQHLRDTAGIECRKDEDVLDESPAAYKDLSAVMAAQSDLVQIKHKLTPLICIKG